MCRDIIAPMTPFPGKIVCGAVMLYTYFFSFPLMLGRVSACENDAKKAQTFGFFILSHFILEKNYYFKNKKKSKKVKHFI